MAAKILQGEEIATRILEHLKSKVVDKQLKLAVVQVGKNAVSETYIHKKEEVALELGIGFELHKLAQEISQTEIKNSVAAIGKDKKVSGLIVQLPLPQHINQQEVLDEIPLEKDVDVLSSKALGLFSQGALPWLPPTVKAVSLLLKEAKVHLKGARVLVIGAGRLVGLPLSLWLLREGATLTIANKATTNLSSLTKQADIIISGVGKAGLITGAMVKKGAVIIDAGTSVSENVRRQASNISRINRIEGDVDFKSVSKKARFLSPVPGGVGPLTVACLFENLVTLNGIVSI